MITCPSCNRDLPAADFAYTDRAHTVRRDVCRQCNRRAWELANNAVRRRERIASGFDGDSVNLRLNPTHEWKPTQTDVREQLMCRAACGLKW